MARRYRIKGGVRVGMVTETPNRPLPENVTTAATPGVLTYRVQALTGGMGLYRYRGREGEGLHYYTGQNVNPLFPWATTLGPLATSISKPGGETDAVTSINVLGGTLVVTFGADVYTYNGSWSALVDTLPAAPSDTYYNADRIYYALGSNGYSYQTAAGSAATDVTANLGTINPAMQTVLEWDEKICCIDTSGKFWYSLTGDASSWEDDGPTLPIPTASNTQLAIYDDALGDPICWALTPFGPFMLDFINKKWFPARFQYPEYRMKFTKMGFGTVFRDSLYVHAQDRRVYKLTSGPQLSVEDVSPDRPDGVPAAFLGELKRFVADNDFMFVQVGDSQTLSGIAWAVWMYTPDGGWDPIYVNTADNSTEPLAMAIISNSLGYRLYFHDNNASDGHIVRYLDLSDLRDSPLVSTTKDYASSGNYELPWFDDGAPGERKLALAARVKLTGAAANETVQPAYGTDFATSYSNLGPAITANTETEVKFGTNNVGVAFNSFRWKFTLARGGTATNAPKIEYVDLDYLRLPQTLRVFNVTIDCSDFSPDGRTPRQQIEDLWTAIETETLGTFAYRDDADNTRSYLVKPVSPRGEERAGWDERGEYQLTLMELNG
ncbi:MAG: hypothetical protein IT318_20385 [Anaerolineales bacterium]|nr:hypothetical protein [Anaerolineales bacterium]